MLDALQILAIAYNIGHFRSISTSSRAIMVMVSKTDSIKEKFLSNFKYYKHKALVKNISDSGNYHRFHLLNSLLIIQSLGTDKVEVKLAINLLAEHMNIRVEEDKELVKE